MTSPRTIPGTRSDSLSIYTDVPSQKVLYLPVQAFLPAEPILVSRRTLWLPNPPSAATSVRLRLSPGRVESFKVLGVDVPDARIKVETNALDDGVWDIWQVEGPSMLWLFRGAPHVHTWVHIREPA